MDNLNAGNESVDTSTQTSTTEQTSTQATEPQPIELDENALIRVKGSEKPVKFGEHVRGFQSKWTQEAQKRAQLERTLQEREARLQQMERERQAAERASQQGKQGDVFQALRELPYLDGETAVKVVQGIAQQIQQRDQVLMAALNQMKQMQAVVQRLNQTHVTSSFDAKIDRWLGENGWPADLRDLAKEVYLAYEGDDLDAEFPRIFNSRVEQMRKAFEAERQAKLRASKPAPFLPGRGGNAQPSKPLEFKGNESARDISEKLWEQLQVSGT
jgi:hypothetical protein